MLGAAYEYLLKEFADSAGKKGGEFYTPTHVCIAGYGGWFKLEQPF